MSDRGSGSVLAIAVLGALFGFSLLLVPIAGALQAKTRMAAAADAAALAAADAIVGLAPGVPCEVAARVASANGAAISDCAVDGEFVTVSVQATVSGIRVSESARAGPPGEGGN